MNTTIKTTANSTFSNIQKQDITSVKDGSITDIKGSTYPIYSNSPTSNTVFLYTAIRNNQDYYANLEREQRILVNKGLSFITEQQIYNRNYLSNKVETLTTFNVITFIAICINIGFTISLVLKRKR